MNYTLLIFQHHMATIINTPGTQAQNDNGTGVILAVILAIILVVLLAVYGFPALRRGTTTTNSVNVQTPYNGNSTNPSPNTSVNPSPSATQ